jgi:site-specific DNA-adenine methylase
MLKKILPLITPHVCYCEPFAGGLAVLMAKERSQVEVVNDINGKTYTGWDEPEMRRFAKRVEKLKGNWIVTVNDCPVTRELFAGHQIESIQTPNKLVNNRLHGNVPFGELLITP